MSFPGRKDWLAIIACACCGGVVYLLLSAYRMDADLWLVLQRQWFDLLTTTVLIVITGLFFVVVNKSKNAKQSRAIAKHIKAFSENPMPHGIEFNDQIKQGDGHYALELFHAIETILASFRQALSDRVRQNETIESMRSLLGQADHDRGQFNPLANRRNISSRDMVARFTPTLHWLTATPSLQSFLGFPMSELNGRSVSDLVHSEDLQQLRHAVQNALEVGEAHNVIFRLRIRSVEETGPRSGIGKSMLLRTNPNNPEERYIQADMLTRYNELGMPNHVRCYMLDVTDKIVAEKALRRRTKELLETNEKLLQINKDLQQLKESYRDLYNHAPVMYFSLDGQGRFVVLNDTMLKLLGYPRAHLSKQDYGVILTPKDQKRFYQSPQIFTKPGEFETQWVKQDGKVIDVWIRSTILRGKNGEFLRSRSVAQDVTERNRLAAELQKRKDELEKANQELLQKNETLDGFARVVSHDLRAPLQSLRGYGEQLRQKVNGRLETSDLEDLDRIVQMSNRLENFNRSLLWLAKEGKITKAWTSINLVDLLKTVTFDHEALLHSHHAQLQQVTPLPTVFGDRERIYQVFSNLLVNAIKFNRSETPLLQVGCSFDEKGTHAKTGKEGMNFVTLFFQDNGIGIAAEYQTSIFEPFDRGNREGEFEGTGTGLGVVKEIVAAHGGKIWVNSTVGHGSQFCFTWPLAWDDTQVPSEQVIQNAEAHANTANGAASSNEHAEKKSQNNVLLVEDMPEIALFAQRLAQDCGLAMTWVASAEAAWEYLLSTTILPDLIVLDVHLPKMNGIDFCKQLRQDLRFQHLCIALFSQLEQHEMQDEIGDVGADYFLSKELLWNGKAWQAKLTEILQSQDHPTTLTSTKSL